MRFFSRMFSSFLQIPFVYLELGHFERSSSLVKKSTEILTWKEL